MKFINVLNLADMTADYTKKLNEIALCEKKAFTALIDKYTERYGDSRFWWATTLSSRNTNLERAFWSFCATKLVDELLKENSYDEVIVPMYSLKLCLEHNFPSLKVTCVDDEKDYILKIKEKRRSSIRHIINTVNFNKRKATNCNKKNIRDKRIYIVDTYDIGAEFSNGKYKDRYFGGLDENTDEIIIYLSSLYYENRDDAMKIIEGINRLDNRYVIDTFYRLYDYIEILLYWWFCERITFSDAYVDGLYLGDLLLGEVKYGKYSITSYYGLLKSKAVLRFIRIKKAKVNSFIGWYEGQPSSNALFFEIRRKTKIKTAAYVCTPLHDFGLGLSPSKGQIRKKGGAEYICIQGNSWKKQVKEFCDSTKIVRAPSFRYRDTFASMDEVSHGEDILVVLPLVKESSKRLLLAVDQIYFKKTILIKNHPANEGMTLMNYGIDESRCRNKYRLITGSMRDSLFGVDIAILTETTSALEVLLNGVKVIVWNKKGALRNSCVPYSLIEEGYVNIVYTEDELRCAIDEFDNIEIDKNHLKRIKREVFVELTRENVSAWLKEFE